MMILMTSDDDCHEDVVANTSRGTTAWFVNGWWMDRPF